MAPVQAPPLPDSVAAADCAPVCESTFSTTAVLLRDDGELVDDAVSGPTSAKPLVSPEKVSVSATEKAATATSLACVVAAVVPVDGEVPLPIARAVRSSTVDGAAPPYS